MKISFIGEGREVHKAYSGRYFSTHAVSSASSFPITTTLLSFSFVVVSVGGRSSSGKPCQKLYTLCEKYVPALYWLPMSRKWWTSQKVNIRVPRNVSRIIQRRLRDVWGWRRD